MGPSCMRSVLDRNVVMWHVTVLSGENQITGSKTYSSVTKPTTNPTWDWAQVSAFTAHQPTDQPINQPTTWGMALPTQCCKLTVTHMTDICQNRASCTSHLSERRHPSRHPWGAQPPCHQCLCCGWEWPCEHQADSPDLALGHAMSASISHCSAGSSGTAMSVMSTLHVQLDQFSQYSNYATGQIIWDLIPGSGKTFCPFPNCPDWLW